MAFLIGLLTLILVLDCVVLVLLVLIQLPKKDAGAGLAFGGAASDALFGAGSGNVLTKVTKYAAGVFFVLAIGLSLMQNRLASRGTSAFSRRLAETGAATTGVLPTQGAAPSTPVLTSTNVTPQAEHPVTTNTPPAPK